MAGVKIRDVISIASGPETRIHPIAPPWAVAMAYGTDSILVHDFQFVFIRQR